jgi:hypothetical protein
MPSSIISVKGGILMELIFLERIGVYYKAGYSHSLSGHSSIEADYRYNDDIRNTSFTSKDSGFLNSIGLKYYF